MTKILIACEESQAVCKAFRALGYEAYSCDLLECSGGHPEWHIQGDALEEAYSGKYDMMIAHPPCTYLSNAGARFLYPKGVLNETRLAQGLKAKEFFMKLWNAPIKYIAVENPIPSTVYGLPKYSHTIQPYEFGHPFKKKTCLWLKNLPPLIPTHITEKPESTKVAGNWFNKGGKDRQKNRSKTFQGIADAMAQQWSQFLNNPTMPNTLRERFDEKFGDWTLGFDEIVEFLEQEISLVRQEALKEGEESMKQKMKSELEKSIKWYRETDGTYDDYVIQHNKRIIKALKDKVDFISKL